MTHTKLSLSFEVVFHLFWEIFSTYFYEQFHLTFWYIPLPIYRIGRTTNKCLLAKLVPIHAECIFIYWDNLNRNVKQMSEGRIINFRTKLIFEGND